MKYLKINYCDYVNGTGLRTVLFVSGCTHHCKGCFQPETWNFDNGYELTDEVKEEIIDSAKYDYIDGITLLGGDPMEPVNQRGLLSLVKDFKTRFPGKTVWCYTGYTYERDLLDADGRARTECTDEFLSYIDVLVDGEFIEELKDTSLEFRGSSNQRIIELHQD